MNNSAILMSRPFTFALLRASWQTLVTKADGRDEQLDIKERPQANKRAH
jgi:hypothetical protein